VRAPDDCRWWLVMVEKQGRLFVTVCCRASFIAQGHVFLDARICSHVI
jgi:hypothetical protein